MGSRHSHCKVFIEKSDICSDFRDADSNYNATEYDYVSIKSKSKLTEITSDDFSNDTHKFQNEDTIKCSILSDAITKKVGKEDIIKWLTKSKTNYFDLNNSSVLIMPPYELNKTKSISNLTLSEASITQNAIACTISKLQIQNDSWIETPIIKTNVDENYSEISTYRPTSDSITVTNCIPQNNTNNGALMRNDKNYFSDSLSQTNKSQCQYIKKSDASETEKSYFSFQFKNIFHQIKSPMKSLNKTKTHSTFSNPKQKLLFKYVTKRTLKTKGKRENETDNNTQDTKIQRWLKPCRETPCASSISPSKCNKEYPCSYSFYSYIAPSETDDNILPFRRHILSMAKRKCNVTSRRKWKDAFMDRRIRCVEYESKCKIYLSDQFTSIRTLPCRRIYIYGPTFEKISIALSCLQNRLPEIMKNAIFHETLPCPTSRWSTHNNFMVHKLPAISETRRKPMCVNDNHAGWRSRIMPHRLCPPRKSFYPIFPKTKVIETTSAVTHNGESSPLQELSSPAKHSSPVIVEAEVESFGILDAMAVGYSMQSLSINNTSQNEINSKISNKSTKTEIIDAKYSSFISEYASAFPNFNTVRAKNCYLSQMPNDNSFAENSEFSETLTTQSKTKVSPLSLSKSFSNKVLKHRKSSKYKGSDTVSISMYPMPAACLETCHEQDEYHQEETNDSSRFKTTSSISGSSSESLSKYGVHFKTQDTIKSQKPSHQIKSKDNSIISDKTITTGSLTKTENYRKVSQIRSEMTFKVVLCFPCSQRTKTLFELDEYGNLINEKLISLQKCHKCLVTNVELVQRKESRCYYNLTMIYASINLLVQFCGKMGFRFKH